MMKYFLLAALMATVTLNTQATEHQFTVGGTLWDTEVTDAIMDATFPEDWGIGDYILTAEGEPSINPSLYFVWQHDNANYPNLKISANMIEHTGTGSLIYGDLMYTIDNGQINMNHYDLSLFWSVFDTSYLQFDMGITVRALDGVIGNSDSFIPPIPLEMVIPLLYTHTQLPLANNFSAGLEFLWGDYDGQSAIDASLYAAYTSDVGLGFNIGYRLLNTDIKTEAENLPEVDVYASMDFKGAFAGVFFNF